MKRVLENEVTETVEEAHVYDEMDHAGVNQRFVDDLLASCDFTALLNDSDEEFVEVLDVGTGTARIPIELASRTDSHVRIYAIDMSIPMLDVARMNIEFAGMHQRIQLDRMDAKALSFGDSNRFPVVISNSIIHHLPDPKSCLEESVRMVQPGGFLFFRDLARPGSDDAVRELVEQYVGGEPESARKMFDDSLRAALELDDIRAMIVELGFEADTVNLTSDRHWTWAAVKPR